jgi:hypothetical protein
VKVFSCAPGDRQLSEEESAALVVRALGPQPGRAAAAGRRTCPLRPGPRPLRPRSTAAAVSSTLHIGTPTALSLPPANPVIGGASTSSQPSSTRPGANGTAEDSAVEIPSLRRIRHEQREVREIAPLWRRSTRGDRSYWPASILGPHAPDREARRLAVFVPGLRTPSMSPGLTHLRRRVRVHRFPGADRSTAAFNDRFGFLLPA